MFYNFGDRFMSSLSYCWSHEDQEDQQEAANFGHPLEVDL
jgi:hypothetical protein